MAIPGFRVTGELGRTPSGTVHLAESERLGHSVALKMLEAPRSADPETRERFLAGARRQAALSHPHVVQVVEFGVADGVAYVATHCCRGGDLDQRVARGMTLRDLASALENIASALDVVHAEGLVHRDVTPTNILFREDGTAQLNDFGISLETGAGPSVSPTGTVLGSPGYMSPEQVTGATLDGRADLYSLGCVAYYLLTGKQVFTGDTAMKVITQHLQAVVVPPSERTELPIPAALEHLVLACLAKKPAERPQNARQLAHSLETIDGMTWGEKEAHQWWSQHHPSQPSTSEAITL